LNPCQSRPSPKSRTRDFPARALAPVLLVTVDRHDRRRLERVNFLHAAVGFLLDLDAEQKEARSM
jgi:hypothetical protein